MERSHTEAHSHGWLDKLAVSMAMVCAVHCLLTPVLLVMLPIVATSFFVHENFHLWMLLLVLPTTTFAVFMGCRDHKDRWVAVMSAIGLGVLIFALVQGRQDMGASNEASAGVHDCASCSRDLASEPIPLHANAWINTLGGLFLASAHIRNYRLCRKSRCAH